MRASLRNVSRPEQQRRGSAILEFALAATFIFLPMLAGLATVGMSLITAMQVASLNATGGEMLASGVDFITQPANTSILQTIAGNLYTSSSGGGIVILSEIDYSAASGYVCSKQVSINLGIGPNGPSLGTSQYAPGQGQPANDPFTTPMVDGQVAYLAETYYNNPQYAWAFAPTGTDTGIYVKAIF